MSGEREIGIWRRGERQRLMALRLAVAPEQRRQQDAAIEHRLEALLRSLPGQSVGAYWPVKAEFDPLPLALRLIAAGPHPRAAGSGGPTGPARIPALAQGRRDGARAA